MSWIMSVVYDPFMARRETGNLGAWRAELLGDLEGTVLEIGAGTGANVPHYGRSVQRLLLTEPDRHMRQRLADAWPRRQAACPMHLLEAPAEDLSVETGSVDAVVATLVFCSVRSTARALREVARVLRPGGRLVFLEHAEAADGTWRRRWQHLAEPLWRPVAGNCHLTRRPDVAIRAAGFDIEWMRWEEMQHAGPLLSRCVRGVARKPAPSSERVDLAHAEAQWLKPAETDTGADGSASS
ncbi:MAG: class I SAM-dependent methyltransferase [Gemmatimonadaceae bacterium]|nr:class I SAM-dependent methyltransferase [Gemmatimonadaceae bacterium]